MTEAEILRHVRQLVLVLDEFGTIVQIEGSSMGAIGHQPAEILGRNALDLEAPAHVEPLMFVFAGSSGDHIVRDRHAPFPLGLIDGRGETIFADCAAERVVRDGEVLWVTTLMPHSLQSASFHALAAYSNGASTLEVASTIAERLSWCWDDKAEIRSFVLSASVGESGATNGRFDTVDEPTVTELSAELLDALAADVAGDALWHHDIGATDVVVAVEELPSGTAAAARQAGFEVASIAIAVCAGAPRIGFVSFGQHAHAFSGNLAVIMSESIRTLEVTMQRERAAVILQQAAEEDSLTGLSNRSRFAAALDESAEAAGTTAVLYLDLDHFKQVNDTYGHGCGDAVLIEVANRITSVCRPHDVVARLGGDEFAVLLGGVDDVTARLITQRVLDRIAEPLPADLGPHDVTASAGLARRSALGDDVERADLAMLDGKRSGRSRLVVV